MARMRSKGDMMRVAAQLRMGGEQQHGNMCPGNSCRCASSACAYGTSDDRKRIMKIRWWRGTPEGGANRNYAIHSSDLGSEGRDRCAKMWGLAAQCCERRAKGILGELFCEG